MNVIKPNVDNVKRSLLLEWYIGVSNANPTYYAISAKFHTKTFMKKITAHLFLRNEQQMNGNQKQNNRI